MNNIKSFQIESPHMGIQALKALMHMQGCNGHRQHITKFKPSPIHSCWHNHKM